MKHVFIVNGFPRSGKDTFAQILGNYVLVMKRSSVDVVKRIATDAGWDGVKDEKGRKLLAALKHALVEYNDLPLKYMASEYEKFLVSDCDVLLLDIREPDEILKAKEMFDAKTVFIENKNISNVYTNAADASIQTTGYDYVVQNNSTLEVFEANIIEFIKQRRLEE